MKPILVRGGGDLASGVIDMLSASGYPVIVLEIENPSAIRRLAAFSEAVRQGEMTVDGRRAVLATGVAEAIDMAKPGEPVVLVDPDLEILKAMRPEILIDAIIAKRNLGTNRSMADLVIGLGPGFTAGVDVDYCIETKRGHRLGAIIAQGSAAPNSGIPGNIGGYTKERVIHSPAAGIWHEVAHISDLVEAGEVIAQVETEDGFVPVPATITGVLRGTLPEGYPVWKGLKAADIDPRKEERDNCFTISDKARCIAGGVLQLVAAFEHGARPDRENM